METSKEAWAARVLDRINSQPETPDVGELYQQALAANAAATGEPAPQGDPWAMLAWLRGDEPAEAHAAGDSPEDYADFLTTEWDLYGPEGE